jgi:uncharacterized protein
MLSIAEERLMGFPCVLREAGLAIDPARSVNFLKALTRVELHNIEDLKRSGRITLTSSPAEFSIYDAVFKSWFSGEEYLILEPDADDDETQSSKPKNTPNTTPKILSGDAAGSTAAPNELLIRKTFGRASQNEQAVLTAIAKLKLPSIKSRKWKQAAQGPRIDISKTTASARKTFGETIRLHYLDRPATARKMLLLIDVSGSMKANTEAYLRAAHALVRRNHALETFCFSTKLTRVTNALRHRNPDMSLQKLASLVVGFDGGTRMGDSLEEFLSVSRYASLVRGAITIVLSDGLEIGSPDALAKAVERLSRLSHRLVWLTPLASDPRYKPVTRAMADLTPHLDWLGDGSTLVTLHKVIAGLTQIEQQPRREALRLWNRQRSIA